MDSLKKIGLAMVILVVLAIVAASGIYIGKNLQSNSLSQGKAVNAVQSNESNLMFADDNPVTVVNSLRQYLNKNNLSLNFKFEPTGTGVGVYDEVPVEWWESDNGWSILVPHAVSISTRGNFMEGRTNDLNDLSKELNEKISKIFMDNGFVRNENNSRPIGAQNYRIAFQKGETRCTSQVVDYENYEIQCADNFQDAYDGQIPYLEALNDRKDLSVFPREIGTGGFVWVGVSSGVSGGLVLMKNTDGKVELVYEGFEIPCAVAKEKQIPKEVYGVCYDEAGNIVK